MIEIGTYSEKLIGQGEAGRGDPSPIGFVETNSEPASIIRLCGRRRPSRTPDATFAGLGKPPEPCHYI